MNGVFVRVVSGEVVTRMSKANKPYRKQAALLVLPNGASYPFEAFLQEGAAAYAPGDYELAPESVRLARNGRGFELDPRLGVRLQVKRAA